MTKYTCIVHCNFDKDCIENYCWSKLNNGTARFKNVNNYLNTSIYSYIETSGGQSSNQYLNVLHFLRVVLIRHLWQLKTVVFLHWCLICTVLWKLFSYSNGAIPFHKPSILSITKKEDLIEMWLIL